MTVRDDEDGKMNDSANATGESAGTTLQTADIARIMQLMPHRYPFLLIDRLIEMDGDRSCIGIKNVSVNEPYFQGHFPGTPVMPGVLLVEGMAQTAGALCMNAVGEIYEPELIYLMSIDRARFRRPVIPGDQVHFHIKKIRNRGRVWRFRCLARVDGKLVAESDISAMIIQKGDLET